MRRRKSFILLVLSFTSESVMSHNQYRLESINMGDASACAWRLDTADLQVDLTAVEVFELVYQNSIKDIEMGEMYSNSVFTLTPASRWTPARARSWAQRGRRCPPRPAPSRRISSWAMR